MLSLCKQERLGGLDFYQVWVVFREQAWEVGVDIF